MKARILNIVVKRIKPIDFNFWKCCWGLKILFEAYEWTFYSFREGKKKSVPAFLPQTEASISRNITQNTIGIFITEALVSSAAVLYQDKQNLILDPAKQ